MEFFIQLIGFLGILASIISFQCKRGGNILIFRTLNEMLFAVQYFFLGAYTGTAMNIVGSARNLIFKRQIKNGRSTVVTAVIFCICFTVFGIFTWQGIKSILTIVAKILSTIAYGNKNTTFVRCVILITSASWLIYNAMVFSIAGVICEMFTLGSIIVSLIRYGIHMQPKEK